jgi:hypothetical protein
MQVLEAANVCDLTDAANAKRNLDECKGRAERAEEDVKNLKNANFCNLTDAQNAKTGSGRAGANKCRINRERMLLAVLAAIFVIHLLAPRTGLLLFGPWLAGACVVYSPRLWQRASSFRFTAIR